MKFGIPPPSKEISDNILQRPRRAWGLPIVTNSHLIPLEGTRIIGSVFLELNSMRNARAKRLKKCYFIPPRL